MNCHKCNELLLDPSQTTSDSMKLGEKLTDGNFYCRGCADCIDMFGDFKKIPVRIETPEKVETKMTVSKVKVTIAPQTVAVTTKVLFTCTKCHKATSGFSCEYCGTASPLCRRRK